MSEKGIVGVVGAGTMGSGIAIVSSRAGFRTILFEMRESVLEKAVSEIKGFFAKSVEKGKLSPEAMAATIARLVPTTDKADLADCDFIIEAVYEVLKIKQGLLSDLNGICKPETIFASNTSTLSITEIAGASGRQERMVGMHFCLPAQVMRLVEVSPGLATDPIVFEKAWQFCRDLGQKPVKTQDQPGFILNYVVVPWHNDAIRLVEAGVASPADIDLAVKTALGYPMGPLELLDYVGLDTQLLLSEAFYPLTLDRRAACPPLVRRMVAANHLGRKTGKGFYEYSGSAMFGGQK